MPQERLSKSSFSPDITEFLSLLMKHDVRYLIVGGEAVIFYGYARLTGDIDIFYDLEAGNTENLYRALDDFWSGSIPGVDREEELREEGIIIQFGRPPNRIDLINRISGVNFQDVWAGRNRVMLETGEGEIPLHFISLDDLIRNKEQAGRPKDLDDLEYLRRVKRGK